MKDEDVTIKHLSNLGPTRFYWRGPNGKRIGPFDSLYVMDQSIRQAMENRGRSEILVIVETRATCNQDEPRILGKCQGCRFDLRGKRTKCTDCARNEMATVVRGDFYEKQDKQ